MANENEKNPLRKEGRKRGTITQKMVSFRLDAELEHWVNAQSNKGRYLNELIRQDMNLRSMNVEPKED